MIYRVMNSQSHRAARVPLIIPLQLTESLSHRPESLSGGTRLLTESVSSRAARIPLVASFNSLSH